MMTWTKLGDEFLPATFGLTDGEFRTHVDALVWSSWRMLDLHVPKSEVPRFANTADPEAAIDGLIVKGWWEDRGDCWYIGVQFAEWQLERTVVEKRRDAAALRKRRQRMHDAGDHSICLRCTNVTRDVAPDFPPSRSSTPMVENPPVTRDGTRDPGRVGAGRGTKTEGRVLTPLPSPNPGDANGSVKPADDDQQIPPPRLSRAQPQAVTRARRKQARARQARRK